VFSGDHNSLLVMVDDEVANDREASLCFWGAWASASATFKIKGDVDRKAFEAAMDAIDRSLNGHLTAEPRSVPMTVLILVCGRVSVMKNPVLNLAEIDSAVIHDLSTVPRSAR
jgi:hypothetical protein